MKKTMETGHISLVILAFFAFSGGVVHGESQEANEILVDKVKVGQEEVAIVANKAKVVVAEKAEKGERRYPKLGFNVQMPNIPGLNSPTSTIYPPTLDGNNYYNDQQGYNIASPSGLGITSTAFLIKSGLLGGLTAIKAAIIPPLFIGSIIVFLIAGAIFFTCNVVNCGFGGGGGGGLSNIFGGGGLPSFSNIFNRNGYDQFENYVQPVYQSIDEGYKKFR